MRKLRILIGNNTLSYLAGSETWTYTMAVALKKLGHDVTCFAGQLGVVSDRLAENGIRSFNNINKMGVQPWSHILTEDHEHEYDVIIANHHKVVEFLRNQFPKTPIISTIHGVMHSMEGEDGELQMAPEHPALNSGVNQFVAVSEEVQEKLLKDYNIESVVVRNAFDLRVFKPTKKIRKTPKQILFNSNYNAKDDDEVQVIRDVAKHYGAKLAAIGQNYSQTLDVQDAIKDSDIVVGMGRSVLEGVAMGRLGIVHGRWGTGGIVNEGNIEKLRACNFSGRNALGVLMTKEELIKEIDANYTKKNIDWGVNYIKREHNFLSAAEEYVRIARELTGDSVNAPDEVRVLPYKRAES